jgi:hypothetical protein
VTFWNPFIRAKRDGAEELPPESRWSLMSRVRAGCFTLVGIGTAVALTVVAVFANAGLHFLPMPALPLPPGSTPHGISSGTALSDTSSYGSGVDGSVSVGAPLAIVNSTSGAQGLGGGDALVVDTPVTPNAEGSDAGSTSLAGGKSVAHGNLGDEGPGATRTTSPEGEVAGAPTAEVAVTPTSTSAAAEEEALAAAGSTSPTGSGSSPAGGLEKPSSSGSKEIGPTGEGEEGTEAEAPEEGSTGGEEEEPPAAEEEGSSPIGPGESEVEAEAPESSEGEGPFGETESTTPPAAEAAPVVEESAPAEAPVAEAPAPEAPAPEAPAE